MIIPAALVVLTGILVVVALLVYRLVHPVEAPEDINPSHFLIPSQDVLLTAHDGAEMPAWWIPGTKGAPAIILVPGHGMSRADSLSLASALRQKGFHGLTFDLRGSGAVPIGSSSLGPMESMDLLGAINFVRTRPEADKARIGIWGVDVGAWAALTAAAARPEVAALAVDSVFTSPSDFVRARLAEDFGSAGRMAQFGCSLLFRAYSLMRGIAHREIPLQALADRSVLFIQGENRRDLARTTESLYDRLKSQKEMISVPKSRVRRMTGEELRNYDRQVSNFFALHMPVKAQPKTRKSPATQRS
jgi:pimeloyl-ACP methyl ester carboxylesterase